MAKPTKYAPAICIGVSVLAVIGVIISFIAQSPIPLLFLLLPAAGYEVYRTEGDSTKAASALVLAAIIFELILLIFHIDFNLASYLEVDSTTIAGYLVPLGALSVVGPTVMAILAIVLFIRTYGVYTRWLAVIIFLSAFVIIYLLNPVAFQELLKMAVKEVVDRLSYSI